MVYWEILELSFKNITSDQVLKGFQCKHSHFHCLADQVLFPTQFDEDRSLQVPLDPMLRDNVFFALPDKRWTLELLNDYENSIV